LRILTSDNTSYELDFVPDEIDDIRYCVLDYSDKQNPDYFFMPLVFLEIFNAPAAVLQIGNHQFKMPIDWSLIISDAELGDPEVVPITSLNDRGFNAFTLNPISSYMPEYQPVEIVNVYNEVKWHFPKLKQGHLLGVPLSDEPGAKCVFFAKETNKIPDVLDITQLW
jgi:hypothetical protein